MATIGLSMIVKNGGDDLRLCLESVRSLVDQIVIADTGSTDSTRDTAAEFGATVVSFPWKDHYAEARNAALEPLTTDWILVLDADEELTPEAASAIPELLERSAGVGGYQLVIRNYTHQRFTCAAGTLSRANHDNVPRAKDAPSYVEHRLCRLFRRHPAIFFSGRVHEEVERQIRSSGLTLCGSDLRILHFGNLADASHFGKKQEYYRRVLRTALEESPDMPHLWMQLGIVEREGLQNSAAALECFENAVRLNPKDADAWAMIGTIQRQERRFEEAVHAFQQIPEHGDLAIVRAWSLGDLFHDMGLLEEARTMYLRARKLTQKEGDSLCMEFRSDLESKLGYTEVRLGLHKSGFRRLRRAIRLTPKMLECHDRLVKACVLVQDDNDAADAAEAILQHFASEKIFLRAAALRLRIQQREHACRLLETAVRLFPESDSLRKLQSQSVQAVTE
jgi:glycosyltransferase involved in cell wall biosynthesis